MTTCANLDRWLDEGREEGAAAAMAAHAAGCARCGRALSAGAALDAALAAPPAGAAPPGFTDAALARALSARPAGPVAAARPGRPWWRVVLPWLPALGLCAAGASWAGALAWEAVAELLAAADGSLPSLDALSLAGGAAAAEAQLEAWVAGVSALPPAGQAAASLAASAALTALAFWLVRRVEGRAMGRARA